MPIHPLLKGLLKYKSKYERYRNLFSDITGDYYIFTSLSKQNEFCAVVDAMLVQLGNNKKRRLEKIVRVRYGLIGEQQALTLKECGKLLKPVTINAEMLKKHPRRYWLREGVTREVVRQKEAKALRLLMHPVYLSQAKLDIHLLHPVIQRRY